MWFTLEELVAYLRVPRDNLDEPAARLLQELADGLIASTLDGAAIVLPDPLSDAGRTALKAVALEVTARAYRNPNGYQQQMQGPFSGMRHISTANGGVYLLDSELARLVGALTPPPAPGAGPVRTVYSVPLRTPAERPWVYG